ncbi:hypothetical protein Thiowin_03767 [Thiorhodovibrio winogradskyi]|uniref:Uncharacterized protein n=2 Tax=Thiorhodovibrio winogradskyi TaxID=77007 RepID=A0ABZ0SDY7_9GAMM
MAGMPEGLPQPLLETRMVTLTSGLYLFRYATEAPDSDQIPVTVNTTPAGNGIVDFFPGEGVSRNTLRKLGDTLVVRVLRADATVLLAKYRVPGVTEGREAEVQIDRVDTSGRFVRRPKGQDTWGQFGSEPTQVSSQPPRQFPVQTTPDLAQRQPRECRLEYFGHIQNQGDVQVPGGWLGDPYGQSRLEGFVIEWPNKPENVDLYYACDIKGIGQTPPVSSSQFAGTRQKGAPILSLTMALGGPAANDYQLSGQVAFQGCMPIPLVSGRKLTGPQGTEPLVAINIQVSHRQGAATPPRYPSPWDDPSVTQIFRQGA